MLRKRTYTQRRKEIASIRGQRNSSDEEDDLMTPTGDGFDFIMDKKSKRKTKRKTKRKKLKTNQQLLDKASIMALLNESDEDPDDHEQESLTQTRKREEEEKEKEAHKKRTLQAIQLNQDMLKALEEDAKKGMEEAEQKPYMMGFAMKEREVHMPMKVKQSVVETLEKINASRPTRVLKRNFLGILAKRKSTSYATSSKSSSTSTTTTTTDDSSSMVSDLISEISQHQSSQENPHKMEDDDEGHHHHTASSPLTITMSDEEDDPFKLHPDSGTESEKEKSGLIQMYREKSRKRVKKKKKEKLIEKESSVTVLTRLASPKTLQDVRLKDTSTLVEDIIPNLEHICLEMRAKGQLTPFIKQLGRLMLLKDPSAIIGVQIFAKLMMDKRNRSYFQKGHLKKVLQAIALHPVNQKHLEDNMYPIYEKTILLLLQAFLQHLRHLITQQQQQTGALCLDNDTIETFFMQLTPEFQSHQPLLNVLVQLMEVKLTLHLAEAYDNEKFKKAFAQLAHQCCTKILSKKKKQSKEPLVSLTRSIFVVLNAMLDHSIHIHLPTDVLFDLFHVMQTKDYQLIAAILEHFLHLVFLGELDKASLNELIPFLKDCVKEKQQGKTNVNMLGAYAGVLLANLQDAPPSSTIPMLRRYILFKVQSMQRETPLVQHLVQRCDALEV